MPSLNTAKLIAACLVLVLVGVPTMSFAKARGGSGGGFSSGSRSSGSSGSMGSRGSRTYQDNGAKPIEQSTTARPSATPPPSSVGNPSPMSRPAPAAQPSWIQRNPLLAGIAGGLAGTWLGHMIFGATETSARTTEGAEGEQAAGGAGSNGMLLLLMVMGGGALWWYMRSRRTPAPNFSGLSRTSAASGSLLAESSRAGLGTAVVDDEITSSDKAAFQQALIDIQTAWSHQDLAGLRRLVTPEMLEYFSTGLAEQASEGIANHVEDVELGRAEVLEAWSEGATQYATVRLSWSARDYSISVTKQPDEVGYVVEGNAQQTVETTEVWTFMRFGTGKWLLSAIQQVA
ncbi:MAG: TIM44-like domain-containing protein [Nitrospira sp.]|nr:TIM44-like domain-containing protein [Nitrospira sp.]